MMPHTLIIGYGNPLRGDDGFGWHAALRLREIIQDAGIEILAVHQLTPELMDAISRARRVIFIDAAVGEDAGKLTVTALETTGGPAAVFTHFATPAALLEGARSLYGAKPEGLLITVVGLDGADPLVHCRRPRRPGSSLLAFTCGQDVLYIMYNSAF